MSFGVVQTMIITLRNNARQRLKNSPFDRKKLFEKKWILRRQYPNKKLSAEQLISIKRKTEKSRKKEFLRNLWYVLFALFVIVFIWYFITNNFDKFLV
jgi:hypothetical protein